MTFQPFVKGPLTADALNAAFTGKLDVPDASTPFHLASATIDNLTVTYSINSQNAQIQYLTVGQSGQGYLNVNCGAVINGSLGAQSFLLNMAPFASGTLNTSNFGAMIGCSDCQTSNTGEVVTGGGTHKGLIWYDGAAWRLVAADAPEVNEPVLVGSGPFSLTPTALAGHATQLFYAPAPGVMPTDVVNWSYGQDPSSLPGWAPSTGSPVSVFVYAGTDQVCFVLCNNNSSSITTGNCQVHWQVMR